MNQALETALDFILAGGPVMFPLMAVSIWLWTLIILKLSWVLRIKRDNTDINTARFCLSSGEKPPTNGGPRGRALKHFLTLRTGDQKADLLLWEVSIKRQMPTMWRYLTSIIILSVIAPLLGLLGTVSGMIQTFDVIRIFGTGNAQAMASGISEALITTQTGLLVAIPGLLAGHALRRQIKKNQMQLVSFQQAVTRWLKSKEAYKCYA
ncbi:MotA/TolQ/ExbB proton channel family protein [Dethiosulfatarculus sandiegensis]|uniref:Flagellar motor protein MotA n=1 Tax=Dethiosulfatarculus sandiegensis TaxID=1429043 RepID=A0A0D2JCK7_9BACT|nr:MotA/TolQ/ExbB proton channel family protein [Dethiosulfatarculus sandiegensis]KIX15874.1 flagellar motor protein MotA [Dethiosulfatarculus sandiegensis]